MDPNMALHELREAFASMLAIGSAETFAGQAERTEEMVHMGLIAAEKFEALDQWLSRGGFAPSAWAHPETEDHR